MPPYVAMEPNPLILMVSPAPFMWVSPVQGSCSTELLHICRVKCTIVYCTYIFHVYFLQMKSKCMYEWMTDETINQSINISPSHSCLDSVTTHMISSEKELSKISEQMIHSQTSIQCHQLCNRICGGKTNQSVIVNFCSQIFMGAKCGWHYIGGYLYFIT
jgi:hypothetical protein